MASRVDWFFRQRVTEAELDLAFELLEKADRDLAADLGIYGIVSGAEPVQHTPVPDLTIDLTAPGRAYDHLGQRIFFGADQRVDCSIDHTGIPTEVSTSGNERWLGVFLKFDRLLSDPRTDGNSQQVFFRRDESFQIKVVQAPEGPIGSAPKVPLVEDELLVCDVRRTAGQTQIFEVDIDTSRRQVFVFATGEAVEIISELWNVLQPAVNNVQAALDSVDEILSGHFDGADNRHTAGDIDYASHGFVEADNVQDAIDEAIDDLSSSVSGTPGASLIGADSVTGTPKALPASNVDSHLSQLLTWLNEHLSKTSGAHAASAISAQGHDYISGPSVQAQLQEIVQDLKSQNASLGASQIGDAAVSGSPKNLPAGTVREHLSGLTGHINTHIGSSDHDPRYYTKSQGDSRYYNIGEKVGDSDKVDGRHASYFATAGHNHDARYLRAIFSNSYEFNAGQERMVASLTDFPEVIQFSYRYFTPSGTPGTTTYVNGSQTDNIRVWFDKTGSNPAYEYELTVRNNTSTRLYISIFVYSID
ncbi:MAG: hypothetical protein GY847_17950 [Proteobacteria bacterium]|nr:hypothetical protein [Pseudomonadota bacterium]